MSSLPAPCPTKRQRRPIRRAGRRPNRTSGSSHSRERSDAARATRWACFALVVALSTIDAAPGQPRANEAGREQWQRVADLFTAMGVHAGDAVADVGAGDGFLTVRLSPVVGPTGQVFAVDVDDGPLERLRKRLVEEGYQNVTVVKGDADDPRLPPERLDSVVILNAYHEMSSAEAMLQHIRDSLKAGGRLVVAEPLPSDPTRPRAEQIKAHRISPALVAEELTRAGFLVIERQDDFAKIPSGGGYSLVVGQRP